jgi:tripartite ATP-independent transporter DctM subunit
MSWELLLMIFFGGFTVVMLSGMPVAFCFMLINIIALSFFWGVDGAMRNFILSIFGSVTNFTLLPLPLFILMGEVIYQAGIAPRMISALDKWMGRVTGRLSILAIVSGTLFANLSGASVASAAMLGSTLGPEMEQRGYKKPMILGPIMAGGGLASMIPPTGLGILVGAVGEISIGKLLIAIYIPGLILAAVYLAYILTRCKLQPYLAPPYAVPGPSFPEKVSELVRLVVPVAFIFFMVIGVIFLGVATPTEAAALGTLAAFILAGAYRKLSWTVIRNAFSGTLDVGAMILMVMVGAKSFGTVLAYSGATSGLIEFVASLKVSPIVIVICMQIVIFILGCFMDCAPITLIALPIFMPIIKTLGLDPVWFGVIFLLNIELATITPPFGLVLFVTKNVSPRGTTLQDVYLAAYPIVGLQLFTIALLLVFPILTQWLPALMIRQ